MRGEKKEEGAGEGKEGGGGGAEEASVAGLTDDYIGRERGMSDFT